MNSRVMRLAAVVGLVFSASYGRAVELKNDGFSGTAQVGFQGGFVVGEIGAVKLHTGAGMWTVDKVRLLFGGGSGVRTVTLHIYQDTDPTPDIFSQAPPGTDLYSADFPLTPSDSAMQELTVDMPVVVSGPFRVGIEFQHMGLPSIARDDDGTISSPDNLMFAIPGGWIRSELGGLTGDWIIRAEVTSVTPGTDAGTTTVDASVPGDAGSSADAAVATDAAVSVPDASTGVDAAQPPDAAQPTDASQPHDAAVSSGDAGTTACQTNAQCAAGSYCGANGACTFDCRADGDCGTGMACNSLGKCVAGSSSSSSSSGGDSSKKCACATTGSSTAVTALLLALVGWRRSSRRKAG